MSEWAGKLSGQMIRLAGLIHCISSFEHRGQMSEDRGVVATQLQSDCGSPDQTLINADETRCAVALARYFLAHAKAVYTEQAEPREITNAKYLWGRIKSIKSTCFNKSELIRKTHNKQNFSLDESLTELQKRGYIRIEKILYSGKKPSEVIFINQTVN
jgi:hypothetical protein